MFRGAVLSQSSRYLLPVFSGGDVGARLEAEAVVSGISKKPIGYRRLMLSEEHLNK